MENKKESYTGVIRDFDMRHMSVKIIYYMVFAVCAAILIVCKRTEYHTSSVSDFRLCKNLDIAQVRKILHELCHLSFGKHSLRHPF